MVRKGFVFGTALLALLVLLWATGGVVAGPPSEGPGGDVSIAATVSSKISYQGVLKENSTPVTGSRDITFRLYSDSGCTTQVGSDIVKSGVLVTDGLFSVELTVTHSNFNGQGLWLEVEVGGAKIGCQEILPVPYALSLKPGAIISDTTSYVQLNRTFMILPGTSTKYGVYAEAEGATYNYGVYGSGSSAAIYGDGDVKQNRTGNGLVKAAVYMPCGKNYLLCEPIRFFNNVTGGQISGICGASDGYCTIDFGFDISDRFWVATADSGYVRGVTCHLGSSNDQLNCIRWNVGGSGVDGNIMVLVY